MWLCSNNHEEICYEARKCPACEIIAERNEEIEHLEELLQEIKDRYGE